MNVADLRQHLADLSKLLASSNAQTVAKDLAAICEGLTPFGTESLKGFADFLVKAHTFSTTGVVPPGPAKKRVSRAKVKAEPNTSVDLDAIKKEIRTIYDQAATPAVTDARIDEAIGTLHKLKKEQIKAIAAAIEYKPKSSDTNPKIIDAIKQRIIARKGSAKRTELLDRPKPPETQAATPQQPAPHQPIS